MTPRRIARILHRIAPGGDVTPALRLAIVAIWLILLCSLATFIGAAAGIARGWMR
jgi:hypothetical protein